MHSPVDHLIAVDHHPACRVPGLQNMEILLLHSDHLKPATLNQMPQVFANSFLAVRWEVDHGNVRISCHLDGCPSLRALDLLDLAIWYTFASLDSSHDECCWISNATCHI